MLRRGERDKDKNQQHPQSQPALAMEASGSLEDLLGQVDSTLAPAPITALPDDDLNALLAATGLDGGGSTGKGADDDAFDDIFGGSVGGGSQEPVPVPEQQGGGAGAAAGGGGSGVAAGGDGSGSTAWKDFGEQKLNAITTTVTYIIYLRTDPH